MLGALATGASVLTFAGRGYNPCIHFSGTPVGFSCVARYSCDFQRKLRFQLLAHALQVGGTWIRKNPSRKIILLNHRRAARPASPETIFSIDYQSIPCSTKKPGAKISFQLGEQFTQTRRPTMQNGEIRPTISEKYFLEKSMKILKNQSFSFLIFRNFH